MNTPQAPDLSSPTSKVPDKQPDPPVYVLSRRNLFSFEGRIGRLTLWLTSIPLVTIELILDRMLRSALQSGGDALVPALIIYFLWLPLFVWISLATQVKRWHDRDRSGWMVLINFIPIAGAVFALVELGCLRGTVGKNRFGDDPFHASPEVEASPGPMSSDHEA